jgi:small-conductance mechanosensitive channel
MRLARDVRARTGPFKRVPFTVAYGEDLSRARSLITEAVTALEAVYDDPEPVCYIHTLGGDGAEFRMRFYHDFETRIATRDEVAQTIIDTLLAADIKLGTPEMIVYEGGPAED